MIINLQNNETGYEAVGKYIRNFWKRYNYYDTVIVSLSFLNQCETRNEIASCYGFDDIEFLYDWWEGQTYFILNGIQYLKDIQIKENENEWNE